MADKPRTYPQQIQDLKAQLEQKDNQINDLLQQQSFVEEMKNEIAHLRSQLDSQPKEDRQESASAKAVHNDLVQRAEQAEQSLKNANLKRLEAERQVAQLVEQLDLLGKERFKVQDLEKKLELLAEELKTANYRVVQAQQQASDREADAQNQVTSVYNELRSLRMNKQAYQNKIAQLEEELANSSVAWHKTNMALVDEVTQLREDLFEKNKTITEYQKLVDEIPDTRAQLQAILGRANAESAKS